MIQVLLFSGPIIFQKIPIVVDEQILNQDAYPAHPRGEGFLRDDCQTTVALNCRYGEPARAYLFAFTGISCTYAVTNIGERDGKLWKDINERRMNDKQKTDLLNKRPRKIFSCGVGDHH